MIVLLMFNLLRYWKKVTYWYWISLNFYPRLHLFNFVFCCCLMIFYCTRADSCKYSFALYSCCCFIFMSPSTLSSWGIMFSGHPSGRPAVVRCPPLTHISRALSGRISMKLNTNIRYASGRWWYFMVIFRVIGQRSRSWPDQMTLFGGGIHFDRGGGRQGWLIQCFQNKLLYCTDCRINDRVRMRRMITTATTTTTLTFKIMGITHNVDKILAVYGIKYTV